MTQWQCGGNACEFYGFCLGQPDLKFSPAGTFPSQKNSTTNPLNGERLVPGRQPGSGSGYVYSACPHFNYPYRFI